MARYRRGDALIVWTRDDPLIRPMRLPDGRWMVEAWAPLEGQVVNGGLRMAF